MQEEIDKLSDNERDSDEEFQKALDRAFSRSTLNDGKRKKLLANISGLISSLRSLTNPFIHGRIALPETVAQILQEDISELVSQYMAIWAFLYKRPHTGSVLNEYLQNATNALSVQLHTKS